MTRDQLEEDPLRAQGLVRLLEIIGEALANVPEPFRLRHPEIPWRQAIGMRIGSSTPITT